MTDNVYQRLPKSRLNFSRHRPRTSPYGNIRRAMRTTMEELKGLSRKHMEIRSGANNSPSWLHGNVVAENILAGNAMHRRSHYEFGMLLSPSVRGSC
ncbi:AVB_G0025950.mRNA.1.CDS.1 [Saccharomyces cerevisiae]|nr:AVB_G0025950.mRNA.1.CDS.1 [Saccharomyces cerevisiae]CAI7086912.1 AVB_G0025950.mRNA.1.CDS.1 [Saccharomyces cerevisiae]